MTQPGAPPRGGLPKRPEGREPPSIPTHPKPDCPGPGGPERLADPRGNLLNLDRSALILKLLLEFCSFFLVYAFFNRLRRTLDQVLGLLEPQAGDGADFLNDIDLLLAGLRQDDSEFSLLLGRRGSR